MKLENKEYHDGGFQQQSPQHLVDINEHMDSRNDGEMMRLKAMPVAWFLVWYSIQ